VLVFVLALLSCVVFYQEVSTSRNWKKLAINQTQRANVAETESRNQMLAAENWERLYQEQKAKIKGLQRSTQVALDAKQTQIRTLQVKNTEFMTGLKELATQLSSIESSLKAAVDRNKLLSDQLNTALAQKIQTENELRHKQDKITEQDAQIETLQAGRRVLDGRIKELQQEVEELARQIAKMETEGVASSVKAGGGTVAVVEGDAKIEATVTAVKDSLASLNVGSASGIKKNMVFILYRGAEFVGNIRIADVGTTNCAGIVFEAVKEVRIGDKATNKLD